MHDGRFTTLRHVMNMTESRSRCWKHSSIRSRTMRYWRPEVFGPVSVAA